MQNLNTNIWLFFKVLFRLAIGIYFGLIPLILTIQNLTDPALKTGQIPEFAFEWHRRIAADIEPWALERVAAGRAAELNYKNVSGTIRHSPSQE